MAASPFAQVKVSAKPALACKGIIQEVPEVKLTDSSDYYMTRVKIAGIEGSKDVVVNFLFRPEWFTKGFDPTSFEPMIESNDPDIKKRGIAFNAVYKNNIGGTNSQISNLKGFCGASDEGLMKFGDLRDELYAKKNAGRTAEEAEHLSADEIHGLIAKFTLNVQPGKVFGYILKQAQQKTDDVDEETGKPIYELRDNYEVGNYFVPSDKARAAHKKRANVDPRKFLVAYES